MIVKILKITVTVIVAVVTVIILLVKAGTRILLDMGAQAKAATPGVMEQLKATKDAQLEKAPGIVAKIDSDIRKVLKVVKTEKDKDEKAA